MSRAHIDWNHDGEVDFYDEYIEYEMLNGEDGSDYAEGGCVNTYSRPSLLMEIGDKIDRANEFFDELNSLETNRQRVCLLGLTALGKLFNAF